MGRRGGHPVERVVHGSTSIAVAGRSRGPVVVVPEHWMADHHRAAPIVVGIAGDRDGHLLDVAFERAHRLGTDLVVVGSWEVLATYSRSTADIRGWAEDSSAHLTALVERWQEPYPEVRVRTRSESLTPSVSLRAAATGAQLLVVGRHTGPRHVGGLQVGSTTRKVLHRPGCPVIVVPPPPALVDTGSE